MHRTAQMKRVYSTFALLPRLGRDLRLVWGKCYRAVLLQVDTETHGEEPRYQGFFRTMDAAEAYLDEKHPGVPYVWQAS